jgi:hypothetical protein
MTTSGRAEHEGRTALAQGPIANSLEQVRDILFGSQQREFARRLARTDAHMAAQAEELRSETKRRVDVLEMHVKKETEALTAAIEAQRSAQLDALNNALRESREAVHLLEGRLKRVEEVLARSQRDFREQLLEQAKAFIDEVQHTREELAAAVEREVVVWGESAEAPPIEAEREGRESPEPSSEAA